MEGDYTGENGAAATLRLLQGRQPPTAIVYDNDLMAVSGLSAAQQMGSRCPPSCPSWPGTTPRSASSSHPPLTALSRDSAACGAHAARALIQAAAGGEVGNHEEAAAVLTVRGSTGAPAPVITG